MAGVANGKNAKLPLTISVPGVHCSVMFSVIMEKEKRYLQDAACNLVNFQSSALVKLQFLKMDSLPPQ